MKAIHDVIVQLHNGIAIKELGTLHHFLGVDIMEFGDGLILSQRITYNKLRWMVQKQNLIENCLRIIGSIKLVFQYLTTFLNQ